MTDDRFGPTFTITDGEGNTFQTTSCAYCGLGLPTGPLGECHICPPKLAAEKAAKKAARKAKP